MKNLLLFLGLFITSFVSRGQTYNPTNFTVSNKAYGIAQAAPTDARSYFYDASLFIQRPYQSTAEVLSYLNLTKYRVGGFPIFISSGTLQSGGTFTGGTIKEYSFRDGTSNSNLVPKTIGVDSVAHFSDIIKSGNSRIISVLTDESNANQQTLYFFDGTNLNWIITQKTN